MIITDTEIGALADRLIARADSMLPRDQPSLQSDMRLAACILRRFLRDGTVFGYVRINDGGAP